MSGNDDVAMSIPFEYVMKLHQHGGLLVERVRSRVAVPPPRLEPPLRIERDYGEPVIYPHLGRTRELVVGQIHVSAIEGGLDIILLPRQCSGIAAESFA